MGAPGGASAGKSRLKVIIRFQKCLRLAAEAATPDEAAAAEQAARSTMIEHGIDPTKITDKSLYDRGDFTGNALLAKLRAEYHAEHPPKPRQ
jgi:hypothetical protein